MRAIRELTAVKIRFGTRCIHGYTRYSSSLVAPWLVSQSFTAVKPVNLSPDLPGLISQSWTVRISALANGV